MATRGYTNTPWRGPDSLPGILADCDGVPIETMNINEAKFPYRLTHESRPEVTEKRVQFYTTKYRPNAHKYPRAVQRFLVDCIGSGDWYITPTADKDPCQHKLYKPAVAGAASRNADPRSLILIPRGEDLEPAKFLKVFVDEARVVALTLICGYTQSYGSYRAACRELGVWPAYPILESDPGHRGPVYQVRSAGDLARQADNGPELSNIPRSLSTMTLRRPSETT